MLETELERIDIDKDASTSFQSCDDEVVWMEELKCQEDLPEKDRESEESDQNNEEAEIDLYSSLSFENFCEVLHAEELFTLCCLQTDPELLQDLELALTKTTNETSSSLQNMKTASIRPRLCLL